MVVKGLTFTFMVMAVAFSSIDRVDARTLDLVCPITGSGDACIFSLTASGAGNLSVATRPCVAGQRWRATIARFNTGEVVSAVGRGDPNVFSGRVVRSTTRGTRFLVIVSLEAPSPSRAASAVVARLSGPFPEVAGPGPRDRSGLFLSFGSGGHPAVAPGCVATGARPDAVFVAPPPSPASGAFLAPTGTLLPPVTTFGTVGTRF
jgi:hypothetical protein